MSNDNPYRNSGREPLVGDVVICCDNNNSSFIIGKEYTITRVDSAGISVNGVSNHGWLANRFELKSTNTAAASLKTKIKLPLSNQELSHSITLNSEKAQNIIKWYFENFHEKEVKSITSSGNGYGITVTVTAVDKTPDKQLTIQTKDNKLQPLVSDLIIED